jgi:acetyl esterase/lipase
VKLPRWIRRVALALAALVVLAVLSVILGWWWLHPRHDTTRGIVYAQRKGHDLTFDVLRPSHPKGLAVLVMISGGWKSGRAAGHDWIVAPLLRRGYTVFTVTHGSQPEFTVMEIVADVQRATRFVRYHAREYGVNPDRLGVAGGSSGGHLSLMLATRGGPARAETADPVDQCSSAVQAVACFFPVTDLLNLGSSTENPGNGGPPRNFVRAFGPNSTNLAIWKGIGRDLSPIYHITSNLPPVLIIHGSADTLVPLDQSERFAARAAASGQTVRLIVRPGKKHGWLTMIWDIRRFADWFDRWLAG